MPVWTLATLGVSEKPEAITTASIREETTTGKRIGGTLRKNVTRRNKNDPDSLRS
jgi:hypothetical protein